ncbi:MAG: glycosyltransferase, partial [Candidatus Hadarchaeum sp.]|uniref:glycosyltransferase n=1 Tax=Candidatus Hadarchaeum sp. TaxID=2883567 RepID=UPI003176036A
MLAKILFLITTMGTGGADRQVVELSSRLKNRGHEILVLSIRPPGPMAKDLIAHRVNFLSIAIDKVTLFQGGKALRDTINIVRKFQPHIIHS